MADLPIMPVMTDALMADCGAMTDERFGQYMKLLIGWWRDGCKPSTEEHLCEICGIDANAFSKLKRLLTETPDGWTQKKLFSVYERQMSRKKKAKESADKRWSSERNANASPEQCERTPPSNAIHEPTSVSPSGDTSRRAAPEKTPTAKATRLPSDWRPPPEYLDYALSKDLSPQEARNEADKFRDYWVAKSGKDATKVDWLATWRNWIRNYLERRGVRAQRDPTRKMDDLRDVLDQAKEFDRAERESLRDSGGQQERRAIGAR